MTSVLKRLAIDDLSVEVEEERIVVSLPGTTFRTLYLLKDGDGLIESPVMSTDSNSPLSDTDFEDVAWGAAIRKAFELGWIS